MLTNKEILTREEVMEFLKIGRSTFYRLLQTGELKGFKATPHNLHLQTKPPSKMLSG